MRKKNHKIKKGIFGQEMFQNDSITDKDSESDELIDSIKGEDYSSEAMAGINKTVKNGEERNSTNPGLSSGDIDADWEDSNVTSEEASMGDNETPDQDIVDSISEPWGTDYSDNRELDVNNKIGELRSKREIDEDRNK